MPRPEKERRVAVPPAYTDFKPTRVPNRMLENVDLSLDEYEAVRLSDYSGLDHAAAAAEMGVSRPTFTRLHDRATRKVARFLIEGLRLSIGGGRIHFRENLYRCADCLKVFPGDFGARPGPGGRGGARLVPAVCPFCKSTRVEDLAASHGHGACCQPPTASEESPEA